MVGGGNVCILLNDFSMFRFFFSPFSFAPFTHQCDTMHRIKVRNYASYQGATHRISVRLYDIQTNMNEERNTDVKKM